MHDGTLHQPSINPFSFAHLVYMEVFTWIGIVTASVVGSAAILIALRYIRRGLLALQWHYYGHERIQELYDFLIYARTKKIESVLRYAKADAITQFLFVRVALYLLKTHSSRSDRKI